MTFSIWQWMDDRVTIPLRDYIAFLMLPDAVLLEPSSVQPNRLKLQNFFYIIRSIVVVRNLLHIKI